MTSAKNPVSSRPEVRIRQYRPGDETAIVNLLDTVFNGWPAFDLNCELIDHWRWRYLDKPANAGHLFVCEADGQIVGCRHSSPVFMKIGEKEYPGELGGDFAVIKSFRNRGLTAKLTQAAMAQRNRVGFWFSYFETPHPKLIYAFSKIAFQLPIHSRRLLRVKNISLHVAGSSQSRHLLRSFALRAARGLNRLQNIFRKNTVNGSLKLSGIRSFDDRFDSFWERISPHYRLIVRRDSEFLNWRYADPRAGDFRVICAEDNHQLIGYIVLRINRRNAAYPVGYVVDLLCEPGRDDAMRTLLADGLKEFDRQQVNAVYCIVPQLHPYREILSAFGFLDTRARNIVFLHANKPMESQMTELESIAPGEALYTFGDIDAF